MGIQITIEFGDKLNAVFACTGRNPAPGEIEAWRKKVLLRATEHPFSNPHFELGTGEAGERVHRLTLTVPNKAAEDYARQYFDRMFIETKHARVPGPRVIPNALKIN